jgi:Domain of unknown function (DUF4191)
VAAGPRGGAGPGLILTGMARSKDPAGAPAAAKQGRIRQLRTVFTITRRVDRMLPWLMLGVFAGTLAVGLLIGYLLHAVIYLGVLSLPLAVLVALVVMARRAERAAFAQITGQPGATGAALQNVRRGWTIETEPVALDPKTHDMVFRGVGRAGVVLVTEGPLQRVTKLADGERKRIQRVIPGVPVTVLHAGDGEGQVPLPKISGKVMRLRPTLDRQQTAEVTKRLRALGGVRPPVPKGIDPNRMRPDRKSMRGR